jgi:hypothetical protein
MLQRWSLSYRVAALVAVLLLLQGASCPIDGPNGSPFVHIGGTNLAVWGERLTYEGKPAYYVCEINSSGGLGNCRFISLGDPTYVQIDLYFQLIQERHPSDTIDRGSIPGGVGPPPPPPGQ